MKHCINCGEPITEHELFCKNCGHKQKNDYTENQGASTPINNQQTEKAPQKPNSKKTKIIVSSLILAIILLFAAYKTIEYTNRPSKLVETFSKDLDDKKVKALNKHFLQSDTDIKINEKETKKFVDYLYENPDELNELKTSLKKEAVHFEKNNKVSYDKDDLLTLNKNGKKWFLFDNYVIKPKAVYLNFSSDENNVIAKMDNQADKKLKKPDKTYTVGPFLPYEYTVKALNKTDYATVEDEEEKDPLNDLTGKYIAFDFEVEGDSVEIYTDYEDATIFINGKDTGVTVSENPTIQPIQTDGSMRIYLQRTSDDEDKKIKSNTISINSANTNDIVEIYFDSENDTMDDMRSTDSSEEADHEDNQYYEEDITEVIQDHYSNIENGNFNSAFQAFSAQKRSESSVDQWSKAYPDFIYTNTPTINNIKSIDKTHAVANIDLHSSYQQENDEESVKNFTGDLRFVKENSTWKLDKSKLKEE